MILFQSHAIMPYTTCQLSELCIFHGPLDDVFRIDAVHDHHQDNKRKIHKYRKIEQKTNKVQDNHKPGCGAVKIIHAIHAISALHEADVLHAEIS